MANNFEFLMYKSAEEDVSVNALIQDETIWLTQKAMGELFGVESHTINYHLKEIFKTEELYEEATTRKIRAVQKEGNRNVERELQFYNLDAIISVGKISAKKAKEKAEAEYDEFNKHQRIVSDFDKEVERMLGKGGTADE